MTLKEAHAALVVGKARNNAAKILEETDWNMNFENTDLAVIYIEAKARLMEAEKKLTRILDEMKKQQ